DCGYPADMRSYHSDNEMGVFLKEVRDTFREGLRRHTQTTLQQQESTKEEQRSKQRKDRDDSDDDSDYGNDSDDESKETVKSGPSTTSSDIAGTALVSIMKHDSSTKESYKTRLLDRHVGLPMSLREFFWWDFLTTKESQRLKVKNKSEIMEKINSDFNQRLTKEMKAQKLTRAIKSHNWRDIDHAVIEAYDITPTLRALDTDERMIQTARTLNILEVQNRNFSTAHIYWLLPIQQVLGHNNQMETKDEEHVMRLAQDLDMVCRHCQLTSQEIFKLSEGVCEVVKKEDPEYYNHIKRCLTNQVNRINIKDFPAEILTKDSKASVKLYKDLSKRNPRDGMKPKHQDIFTDPAIFVRKWIAQGYQGILSVAGGMWVWDQLFLGDWQKETLQKVGVAILSLIKPWLLRANMYSGARK
ncbi:unnamed protein product, partial [Meganyctiphanes norvegica]